MKKKLKVIAITAVSSLMLYGCGGSGSSDNSNTPKQTVSSSITIKEPAQVIAGKQALYEEVIRNTSQLNLNVGAISTSDDIKITSVSLPTATGNGKINLNSKLSTCFVGGQSVSLHPGDSCVLSYDLSGENGAHILGDLKVNFNHGVHSIVTPIHTSFVSGKSIVKQLTDKSSAVTLAPDNTTNIMLSNDTNEAANNVKVQFPSLSMAKQKALMAEIDPNSVVNAKLDLSQQALIVEQIKANSSVKISFAFKPTATNFFKDNYSNISAEDALQVNPANMNATIIAKVVKSIPATIKGLLISQPTTDKAEQVILNNTSSQPITVKDVSADQLPHGVTINQALTSCKVGQIIAAGNSCQVSFNAALDAYNLPNTEGAVINISYQDSKGYNFNTNQQFSVPKVSVAKVTIQAQPNTLEDTIVINKPKQGQQTSVITNVQIKNTGKFTWYPSTDEATYKLLNSIDDPLKVSHLSISDPTNGNACWEKSQGVLPNETCNIGIKVDDYALVPKSYLLQIDAAHNQAQSYQKYINVKGNKPLISVHLDDINNLPSLQKIEITNIGTSQASFSYHFDNNEVGNFEIWNGQTQSNWCSQDYCPNPCQGTNLMPDQSCYLYIHSKGAADHAEAQLSISGSGLAGDVFTLTSKNTMYGQFKLEDGTKDSAIWQPLMGLPLQKNSTFMSVGHTDPSKDNPTHQVSAMNISTDGQVFADGSEGLYKLSKDKFNLWQQWTLVDPNLKNASAIAVNGNYVYAATAEGELVRINLIDKNQPENYDFGDLKSELKGHISSLNVSSDNDEILIGVSNSARLFKTNPDSLTVQPTKPDDDTPGASYSVIDAWLQSSSSQKYIRASNQGVYARDINNAKWTQLGKQFIKDETTAIAQDRDTGTLYASGDSQNIIYKFDDAANTWIVATELSSQAPKKLYITPIMTISKVIN